MSGSVFTIGDVVHLTLDVETGDEAAVDPGSVVLTVKLPDDTVDTVGSGTIIRTGVGLYYSDYPTTMPGTHRAKWVTSAPVTTKVIEFDVAADLTTTRPHAPVYATPAQYQQVTGQAPPDDVLRRLAKASRFVDRLAMTALYDTTPDGFPADPAVAEAFAEATARQLEWELATGDELGLGTVYPTMSIGSVSISRGQGGGGSGSAWERAAPLAADALLTCATSDGVSIYTGFPVVIG